MRATKPLYARGLLLLSLIWLCGCAIARTSTTARIALLAPFEGRYREIGYDALYAARLAISDSGTSAFELLPIDDGGTVERAADRAHALALDPRVVGVVVLGYQSASPKVLEAFGDMPVLIVGNWSASPPSGSVFVLSNPEIEQQLTVSPDLDVTDADDLETPVVGGEVFGLRSFARLRDDTSEITILSSGSLPDPQFAEGYRQSDPFAPQPRLLATLTYDAVRLLVTADQTTRTALTTALWDITYDGLNGRIHMVNGYWENAPIHAYRYDNGQLTAADDIVE